LYFFNLTNLEDPKRRQKNTLLWNYYKLSDTLKRYSKKSGLYHEDAVCQIVVTVQGKLTICGTVIGRIGGTTTAMRTHLMSFHPEVYSTLSDLEQEQKRNIARGRAAQQQEFENWM
jgi:hypothetical protein